MRENIYILLVSMLLSCNKFGTITTQEVSDTISTNPIVSSAPLVRADDIELLYTPGSIPLIMIEDDTLLYLRRKFVAKVFNSPSGRDAIFKLEILFVNSGSNKKVFYINQSNKDFCEQVRRRGRDVVGDFAKREAFIKAVIDP